MNTLLRMTLHVWHIIPSQKRFITFEYKLWKPSPERQTLHQTMANTEVVKKLGEQWRSLDAATKKASPLSISPSLLPLATFSCSCLSLLAPCAH